MMSTARKPWDPESANAGTTVTSAPAFDDLVAATATKLAPVVLKRLEPIIASAVERYLARGASPPPMNEVQSTNEVQLRSDDIHRVPEASVPRQQPAPSNVERSKPRSARPRAKSTAEPTPSGMISQRNVQKEFTLSKRAYLELLRDPRCPLKITRVGKLRLVDYIQFRQWLESRGHARCNAAAAKDVDHQIVDSETVDELFNLGLKPVPRRNPRLNK